MSPVLAGLNDRQCEAVLHAGGPLVVFAGAGSGKTRVITHRIAHLVAERGVRPYRILAVTFTNKAAGEMRARLAKLLPAGAPDLWVGTFHAICARLLRRYADLAGVRPDFVIYDDGDQRAMVTRVMRDLGIDDKRYPVRVFTSAIDRAKNEGLGPEDLPTSDPYERVVQQVLAEYERRMQVVGALDFGDLIYRLVKALRTSPELRAELQARFEHVLVDEYQDTNRVQYELVSLLCAQHRNLCVVGDDDQSIYRFRGADRRNILEFSRQFSDARVIKLEQNYRSTKHILHAANAVVRHNLEREPKTLWTENDAGDKVLVLACEDERDEATLVLSAIRSLLAAGSSRSEIAVLYRTNAQSRVFEEVLRYANLPYRVFGGPRFYDRAEVKDLLAYLRVIQNPDDDVSLLRVINTPTRGIGKTAVSRLLEVAASRGSSVWSALREVEQAGQAAAARAALVRFRELLVGLRKLASEGAEPSSLAEEVLAQTGYTASLEAEDSAEADARLENLREVVGSIVEFEREAETPTLGNFLELVTLQTDADRQANEDSVTLMTVHSAKGLEFPFVFVAGLEEELLPHRGYGDDDSRDNLEEERRLAYVAFTRAERRLVLSYAHARRVYGELKMRTPSRFLRELPKDGIEVVSGGRGPGRAAPARPPSHSVLHGSLPSESYVDTSDGSDDGAALRRGMRVRHPKFGVGQVRAVSEDSPPRVTVSFPGWGEKTLLASYLELG